MLGGRISVQDEDDVEDELEALEAEMAKPNEELPAVPSANIPVHARETEPEPRKEEERAMLAA
jgi:charged multivesicular body protein 6